MVSIMIVIGTDSMPRRVDRAYGSTGNHWDTKPFVGRGRIRGCGPLTLLTRG